MAHFLAWRAPISRRFVLRSGIHDEALCSERGDLRGVSELMSLRGIWYRVCDSDKYPCSKKNPLKIHRFKSQGLMLTITVLGMRPMEQHGKFPKTFVFEHNQTETEALPCSRVHFGNVWKNKPYLSKHKWRVSFANAVDSRIRGSITDLLGRPNNGPKVEHK